MCLTSFKGSQDLWTTQTTFKLLQDWWTLRRNGSPICWTMKSNNISLERNWARKQQYLHWLLHWLQIIIDFYEWHIGFEEWNDQKATKGNTVSGNGLHSVDGRVWRENSWMLLPWSFDLFNAMDHLQFSFFRCASEIEALRCWKGMGKESSWQRWTGDMANLDNTHVFSNVLSMCPHYGNWKINCHCC